MDIDNKRLKSFELLKKFYKNDNYGIYLLAMICFSTSKINTLYDFSIKNKENTNEFFKKKKILKNTDICEIGGKDTLKLKRYGAELTICLEHLNSRNCKDFFKNKRFKTTGSAFIFSRFNEIEFGAEELLKVFSEITQKNCYSIHYNADQINNNLIKKTNF